MRSFSGRRQRGQPPPRGEVGTAKQFREGGNRAIDARSRRPTPPTYPPIRPLVHDAAGSKAAMDKAVQQADFDRRIFDLRMERSRADLFGMLDRLYGARPDYARFCEGADRNARPLLGGAAGRSQMARPQARPRTGLVPAAADGGLRLLHRPLQRRSRRRHGQARLSRRSRHHLRPPDALPEAAAGRQRRRLFGDGLPRHQSGVRHHGRLRGARRNAPPARHQPLRRSGGQPHRQGTRLGEEGAERRRRNIRTTT